ncbi:hypothetical protein RI367_007741 [Sorochytrium milnesiophthora]
MGKPALDDAQHGGDSARPMGGVRLWLTQFSALVRKHALVLIRSPVLLTLALLGPALAILVAGAVSKSLTSSIATMLLPDVSDPSQPFSLKVNVCANSPYCRPAYYYAPNDAYHASVMDAFALATTLTGDAASIADGDIVGFASHDEMIDAFYRDSKQLARRPAALTVAFTTFLGGGTPVSSFADATARLAALNTTTYSLGYAVPTDIGMDPSVPYSYDVQAGTAAATKVTLDAAIIAVRRAQVNGRTAGANGRLALTPADIPDISVNVAAFPRVLSFGEKAKSDATPTTQDQVKDLVRKTAGNIVTTSFMTTYLTDSLRKQVAAQDKHNAHLGVLRKLSLFESAYWASLSAVIVALSILIAAFSVGAAKIIAPSYYLFGNTDLGLIFLLQLLFALAFTSMGLLCVAAISHPFSTTLLTVLVLVACTLTCFALDLMSLDFVDGLAATSPSTADPVYAGQWFHQYASSGAAAGLSLLPFFHYGRIIAELATSTSMRNFTARYTFANLTRAHGPFNDVVHTGFNASTGMYINTLVPYSVPAASLNLAWMAVQYAVYTLLCYLLNQLVVGRSGGTSKSPLMYFTPQYWRARRRQGTGVDARLVEQSRSSSSVIVDGMTKQFGAFTAVNGISMTMRKGRCLALLGHNGAGKSTLINMLSGLLSPTSGNAYVFGHALTDGAMPIQRILGTCPQDDVQYPQLSAREHLRLYARFKGIPTSALKAYVDERLDLVGLLPHADQPAGEFSGGMKRRLSIVSAGIGSPQFIILDEPTTGMDPINRRKVWQYIARLKRDSVLLLTSHSMEETDALGDDICIIDHGQVQATGTSLELKNAHGTGYQVNLLTWQGHVEELCAFVLRELPHAHVSASTATSLSVVVRREHMQLLPPFLATLQTTMRLPESERVVKDWGIQNASLEQVFLKLTRKVEDTQHEQTAVATAAPGDELAQNHEALPKLAAKFRLPSQVWAVIAKNVAFQLKQRKSNVIFTLLVIGLLVAMHYLLSLVLQSSKVCPGGYSSFPMPVSLMDVVAGRGPGANYTPQQSCDVAGLQDVMKHYQTACTPSTSFLCDSPDYGGFKQVDFVDYPAPQVWVSGASNATLATMRSQTSVRYLPQSPALTQLGAATGQDVSAAALTRPFDLVSVADPLISKTLGAQQQIQATASNSSATCSMLDSTSLLPLIQDPQTAALLLRQQFPDRAIALTPETMHATLYYFPTTITYQYSGFLLPGQDGSPCQPIGVELFPQDDTAANFTAKMSTGSSPAPPTFLNLLRQAQQVLSSTYSSDMLVHHMTSALTTTYARQLVGDNESIQSTYVSLATTWYPIVQEMLAVMFIMLISLWLFPMYLLVPFAEREDRLFAYFKVNGLSTMAYWVGNYVYCLLLSVVFLIALVVSAKIYFPSANVGLLILVLVLGIHSTVGLAFLYASFAQSSIIARLLAYLAPVVLTVPCAITVFREIIGATTFTSTWACLFPPMALAYALRITLQNFDLGLLVAPCLMMFIVGFLCIGVAVLVALASERTVSVWTMLKSLQPASRRALKVAAAESQGECADPRQPPPQASEVAAEVNYMDHLDPQDNSLGVQIHHLTKHYGNFHAVSDLTLGMAKGECFGLLGPNGSGKTTTVTMLSGTLAPSSGRATVGGYDTRDPRLPGVLGLCPQESRVMKDLSVEENLLFFARVRGANRRMAPAYARQAASIVGLTGAAYHRAAEHLSGGMRRRLNIAVALIGLPPVIILDEPTTGLDPGNRMQIWDIIAKIRDRREHCIILISHLMEEVDALTSRIGIMAAGSLRCLGNQVSLKNRFASGYTLYVQMTVSAARHLESARDLHQVEAAHIHGVTQFVHSQVCSDAVLRTGSAYNLGETAIDPQSQSWTASFQYRLPGSVDLARVFTHMDQGAAQLGVVEWSLNQSSLEDVFVEVATPYIK